MNWYWVVFAPLVGLIGMMSGGYWGVGCGWFVVPAMLVAGVDILTAVGVALLQMMLSSIPTVVRQFPQIGWGPRSYGRQLALPICGAAMAASLFGKAANVRLIDHFHSEKPIQLIFIFFVALICVQTAFSRTVCYTEEQPQITSAQSWRGGAYGVVAGLISAMCGIGGGIFIRPLLTFVFQVPEYFTSRIVRLAVLLTTGVGGITYLCGGVQDGWWNLAVLSILAALGGLVGFPLGTWMHELVYQAGYAQHIHKSFSLIALFSVIGTTFKLFDLNRAGGVIILVGAGLLVVYLTGFTFYAVRHPIRRAENREKNLQSR